MIKVTRYIKDPITEIGRCAGECWGADTSDDEDNYERGYECLENDHGRTLEFPDITISIKGYSARVIREIYTHIIGTTRLQSSTRYIEYGNFNYITPPDIKRNLAAKQIWDSVMDFISDGYRQLEDLGIKKEDCAGILPLNMESTMVLKINLRAILHMFEMRECTRAYHEFRAFMMELRPTLEELGDEWKTLSKDFFKIKCDRHGYCTEKYSCKKYPKKLKDGTLLYSRQNAFRCPMYKDSHINGCVYSPKFEEATLEGKTCIFCNKCLIKWDEVNKAEEEKKARRKARKAKREES